MFQTVLTYIAVASTFIFCIKLLILLMGSHGSHDIDSHDFDGDNAADLSFKIMSFQSVVAFLMGFSWLGKAALEDWKFSQVNALLIATLFGILIMAFYVVVMHFVNKLNSVHNPCPSECIGKTGTVYMSIPYRGIGQVEISFGGKISIVDAKGIEGENIGIGTSVTVIGVREKVLLVKEV